MATNAVTLECRVNVDLALQAYLRNYGIVSMLELVRDVISMQADPNASPNSPDARAYKACGLLEDVIDAV